MDADIFADDEVDALNSLLHILEIPIVLTSPLDLTPSLLIAILESMQQERLPLSEDMRLAQSTSSKVAAMKIFLGVLSEDVLGVDVGLDSIDPRKLASGCWDEVLFVARMLVWTAEKLGITSSATSDEDSEDLQPEDASLESSSFLPQTRQSRHTSHSPSPTAEPPSANPHVDYSYRSEERRWLPAQVTNESTLQITHDISSLSFTGSQEGDLTISVCHCSMAIQSVDESTTCTCMDLASEANTSFEGQQLASPPKGGRATPRTTRDDLDRQELVSDVFLSPSRRALSNRTSPVISTPAVRYTGWIERVESDAEHFEARNGQTVQTSPAQKERAHQSSQTLDQDALRGSKPFLPGSLPKHPTIRNAARQFQPTRHNSPTQHTIALLRERARLLEELSKLQLSP